MLLELTTAVHLFFFSQTSFAVETPASTVPTSVSPSPQPELPTTEISAESADPSPKALHRKNRRRRRRRAHRPLASDTDAMIGKITADAIVGQHSGTNPFPNNGATSAVVTAIPRSKLPAYHGAAKRGATVLTPDSDESSFDSAASARESSPTAPTASTKNSRTKKSRYKDPTEIPLPSTDDAFGVPLANTPGKGEVSDGDLAPGPIIKTVKVNSTPIGSLQTTELDPSERSFLRFGLHVGESVTNYKKLQPAAQEGARLVGAQMGVSTDLWDSLQLFGIPLSGEENLRLDYATGIDPGVAQMIRMQLDSAVFLGPDLDTERGLLPFFGLGVGWAKAELRSISSASQSTNQSTRTQAQGAIFSPEVGTRWRFSRSAALDLKVEALIATDSRLYDFERFSGQLGLLLFF